MNAVAFADLVRLPIVQYYEDAFRKATGVALKVMPPEPSRERRSWGPDENPFCVLATANPAGCAACVAALGRAPRGPAPGGGAQQIACFAGLTDVAVPVVLDGRHVATLFSGQVFRRQPTERDFALVVQMLGAPADMRWQAALRQAYFETPVVNADRFEAIVQLLHVFAQFLADFAGRQIIAASTQEPPAVASAKAFVQAHVDEPITLAQVVAHVRVSRFYFCKLFKRATGMTLTDYVTRVRLEKAKALLVDRGLRISEVVFAAGFGSIPQFNSMFKRYVGMAPTEYRAMLDQPRPG